MCLAIPGRIEAIDPETQLATADVLGVRRQVNIDLLADEHVAAGDWILIHVGFAMSRISADEAAGQLRLLETLGEGDEAAADVGHP